MKTFDNVDLTGYNSYRRAAKCRTAYFPESEQDRLTLLRDSDRPKILLGGGYNVILSLRYYDTDFIIFWATITA